MGTKPSFMQSLGRGRRLLSVPETAKYLGISPKTIYNGIYRNAETSFPVKPKRRGRRVLFDIRDLESYVDSM